MGTMHKSEKAATFVALSLLAGIGTGTWSFFEFAKRNAVALLVACVLCAFFLILAAIYVVVKLHRKAKDRDKYGVPMTGLLTMLSRRQWLTLTAGLAVIAVATGSLTGIDILTTPTASAATAAPAGPASPPTVTTPAAPPTSVEPSPTPSPAGVPSVSDSAGSPSDSTGGSPVPAPGATTYLDSEQALDGGYDAGPVTFSGHQYLRGISLWCSSVNSSYVQWNVASSVRFTAVAGISDDTSGAYGAAVDLLFYNQDGRQLTGKPVEVSVGHPVPVSIDMSGVVSLRMVCSGRDVKTNQETSVRTALGDPVVVRQ